MDVLNALVQALATGAVRVVDLTQPLGPATPVIRLPPMFAPSPGVTIQEISCYDQRGPAWYWNTVSFGEHTGTHFDAPIHWITGKEYTDGATDTIPAKNFVAPLNVIDCSKEAAQDDDFLLTVDHIKAWEDEHGAIGKGEWVVMRTDWYKRNDSEAKFLNANETGPHTPGPTAEAIEYLIGKGVIGWGSETIGTDAGKAGGMNPPFPAHNLMHKNNRYGLASLCNLDKLPPTGALLITPPLKIMRGSGSPVRVLALVSA